MRRLPQHRSCVSGVEYVVSDSQSPLHRLHQLPRLPPWVMGGSQYRDRHPQGQNASAGYSHEEDVPHEIFLDLQKSYNDMDRYRCLDILEGYGVGTSAFRLLHRYWDRLQMVAREGGGGVLRRTLPWRERCDVGRPTFAHHIQCGGGRSGTPLGIIGGRNSKVGQQQ